MTSMMPRGFLRGMGVSLFAACLLARQVLSAAQRTNWLDLLNIGHAFYHRTVNHPDPGKERPAMTPAIMRDVAERSMKYSDEWSYFWAEFGAKGKEYDFITQPSACNARDDACYLSWLEPIKQARQAAQAAAQAACESRSGSA